MSSPVNSAHAIPPATNSRIVGHIPSHAVEELPRPAAAATAPHAPAPDDDGIDSIDALKSKVTGFLRKAHLTRPAPAAPSQVARYQRARNVLKDLGLHRINKSDMFTFNTPPVDDKHLWWNDYALRLRGDGSVALCATLPGDPTRVQGLAIAPYDRAESKLTVHAATVDGPTAWEIKRDGDMAFRAKQPTTIVEIPSDQNTPPAGNATSALVATDFQIVGERVYRREGHIPLVAAVREEKLQYLGAETTALPPKLALRSATFIPGDELSKWILEFTDDARHDMTVELQHKPLSGLYLQKSDSTTYPLSRPRFLK